MPVTADVSTSVMPPVIEPTVMPTAPDGTPASSMVFSASAVSARTGASLTGLTVIEPVAEPEENAVVPPELAVVAYAATALVDAVPDVWSHALKPKVAVSPLFASGM